MKHPIDIEHANKWLIGFSIISFAFSIAFFVSGFIPGGIALVVVALLLLVPQITNTIRKHKKESTYSIRNKKLHEQREKFIETLIKQNSNQEDANDKQ